MLAIARQGEFIVGLGGRQPQELSATFIYGKRNR